MNCDETFNAGICYITDAYKRVCRFNEELHADLEKYRAENAKLRSMVRDYERCVHANCDRCEYYGPTSTHCPLSPCFPDADELRELGVEVPE